MEDSFLAWFVSSTKLSDHQIAQSFRDDAWLNSAEYYAQDPVDVGDPIPEEATDWYTKTHDGQFIYDFHNVN